MDFQEYLTQKHIFKKGEKKLNPISVNQYIYRLEKMSRLGIYNREKD